MLIVTVAGGYAIGAKAGFGGSDKVPSGPKQYTAHVPTGFCGVCLGFGFLLYIFVFILVLMFMPKEIRFKVKYNAEENDGLFALTMSAMTNSDDINRQLRFYQAQIDTTKSMQANYDQRQSQPQHSMVHVAPQMMMAQPVGGPVMGGAPTGGHCAPIQSVSQQNMLNYNPNQPGGPMPVYNFPAHGGNTNKTLV